MPLDTKNSGSSADRDIPVWVIPAALRQLAECGDIELVVELLAIFRSDTTSRLEVLERALGAGDYVTARTEAHTVKGSALQIGACRLAVLCQQMELEAQNRCSVELARLLSLLRASFAEACAAIDSRKESTGIRLPW